MFFLVQFVPAIASTCASRISVKAALVVRHVALILTFLTWASSVMSKITKMIVSACNLSTCFHVTCRARYGTVTDLFTGI